MKRSFLRIGLHSCVSFLRMKADAMENYECCQLKLVSAGTSWNIGLECCVTDWHYISMISAQSSRCRLPNFYSNRWPGDSWFRGTANSFGRAGRRTLFAGRNRTRDLFGRVIFQLDDFELKLEGWRASRLEGWPGIGSRS